MMLDLRTGDVAVWDDAEALIPYLIVLLTFSLVMGMLIAAMVFPLPWLPGQLAILVAACAMAPLAGIFVWRHGARLSIMQGRELVTRVRILRLFLYAAFLVGIPALQLMRLHPHGSLTSGAFLVPVILSLALVEGAWQYAQAVFGRWYALHAQHWEDTVRMAETHALDRARIGRENRTDMMRSLWMIFVRGGCALSVALFLAEVSDGTGAQPPALLPLALIVLYATSGLILLGRAALLRLMADAQLDRLPLAEGLVPLWRATAVRVVAVVALVVVLVLPLHVLDLAHAMLIAVLWWLWVAVIYPLLSRIPATSQTSQQINEQFSNPHPHRRPPLHPLHPIAPNPFLVWLGHALPWLAAALILLWLIRTYLVNRSLARPWWYLFVSIWLELRKVMRVLLKTTRAASAAAITGALALAQRERLRRPRRRRPGQMLPRELIVYFYGLALTRGQRLGMPRRSGETPGEYAAQWREHLGDEDGAFADLTASFLEARYSRHSIEQGMVVRARGLWDTVRSRATRRRARS